MIEQTAVVTDVKDDLARVRVQRQSTCGGCQAKSACGTNTFAKVLGNKYSEVTVLNSINAEPGDMVRIGLRESVMLKSALLVYVFPLFMLLTGALLVHSISLWLALEMGQLPIITGGLIGLIIAFVLIRKIMNRRRHDERYQPVILGKASLVEVNLLDNEKAVNS